MQCNLHSTVTTLVRMCARCCLSCKILHKSTSNGRCCLRKRVPPGSVDVDRAWTFLDCTYANFGTVLLISTRERTRLMHARMRTLRTLTYWCCMSWTGTGVEASQMQRVSSQVRNTGLVISIVDAVRESILASKAHLPTKRRVQITHSLSTVAGPTSNSWFSPCP